MVGSERTISEAFVSFVALFVSLFVSASFAISDYPQIPDSRLTPGSLCDHPSGRRYPERIAYCQRNVSKSTKWAVINAYNDRLGFHIAKEDRSQFKIDHRIPLCAGGSNKVDNLWPQHQSVYELTDPLEGLACEKMAMGRLSQSRAIELLNRAKTHLREVPEIFQVLQSL
jgi:hypothetical protein